MVQHIRIVGILHIVMGGLGLVGAIMAAALFGGLAGFLGATTDRMGDTSAAAPILGIVAGALFVFIAALSIPSLILGIGLVSFQPWARIVGIVLSALHLLNVPFGTALGIYGLWALLSVEGQAAFHRQRG